ncbi:MAG TPA: hypothetical protein VLK65_14205 [Vicinamibacteria bacterium]|nr:hypothetical protein [Vicinamibacteria bacterium]
MASDEWFLGVSIVGLSLLFASGDALAQEKTRWQIGVSGVAGFPQGDFGESIGDTRWGGSFFFTRRLGSSPVRLGMDLGFHANGSVDVVLGGVGLGRSAKDARLTNDIYFGHFISRVQPVHGRLAPYIEGAFGFRAFETAIVLKECSLDCTLSTLTTSTTVSLGGGGGISFRLSGNDETESRISLEVGARYLFGGETEYFLPSDLSALADDLSPVPHRSTTSMTTVSFGVVFDF